MTDIFISADSSQVKSAKQDLKDLSNSFGSAQKSAAIFEQAFMRAASQMQRDMATFSKIVKANQDIINTNLGVNKAYKSAEESAKSFAIVLKNQEEQAKKTAIAINQITGVSGSRAISGGAGFSAIESEIERLALKYNDVYRALKLYETSLAELTRAEQLGAISTEKFKAEVELLNREFEQFKAGSKNLSNRFVQFDAGMQMSGKAAKRMQVAIQQAGYQVGDFFVQVASGTNPMVAFTQQFTQLAGFIGPFGPVIGAVASVIGALAIAFLSAKEKTVEFKDALSDLKSSVDAVNTITNIYSKDGLQNLIDKYGQVNNAILTHVQLLKEVAFRDAIENSKQAMQSLIDEMEGLFSTTETSLQNTFKVNVGAANQMASALKAAKDAATFDDQVTALTKLRDQILAATGGIDGMDSAQYKFYKKIQDSLDAMMQLKAAEPKASWLSSAISAAGDLAAKLWEAARARVAATAEANKPGMTTGTPLYEQGMYGSSLGLDLSGPGILGGDYPKTKADKGAASAAKRLDSLVESLKTEQETLDSWYKESQDMLQSASDQELSILGGKHEAMLRLEEEYQKRLSAIKSASQNQQLNDAGDFFGALASVAQAGGGKMVKAAAVFSAAQGLINSYVAYTEMLKDPSFIGRPWARFAAAASVLASGLKMVSAIKGVGSGGSGAVSASSASASSTTSATATQAPQTVYVSGLDPNALFTGEMVQNLFESFYDENDKRGKVFVVA